MLLWSAPDPAPNPRRVRLFLNAKGLKIEERMVSLMAREHKSDEVTALNPRGQVPFLELDDGRVACAVARAGPYALTRTEFVAAATATTDLRA